MFVRSISLVLATLSAASAWPIFFYESTNCNHYPVFTLEQPPHPNTCNSFGHVDIRSYSGGTKDSVQKLLLYFDGPVCDVDAAHHAYSNHTIGNDTNLCETFQQPTEIPRTYVFIEELLGSIPTSASACDYGFTLQN